MKRIDINVCLSGANHLDIWDRRMFLALEQCIDFLEGPPFRLYPIVCLRQLANAEHRRMETHDQAKYDNVPRSIDHVHLPANVGKTDWHYEHKNKTASVSKKSPSKRLLTQMRSA